VVHSLVRGLAVRLAGRQLQPDGFLRSSILQVLQRGGELGREVERSAGGAWRGLAAGFEN
jgi:hypothetical protein